MEKTLVQTLVEAGYPRDEIYHHESDLYVYATSGELQTLQVIRDWYDSRGMAAAFRTVEEFYDNVTNRKMYDCPFQYSPWWDERCGG